MRRLHNQRGLTTILVTHNLHEAVFLSDRVLVLNGSASFSNSGGEIIVPCPAERTAEFREPAEFVFRVESGQRTAFVSIA